MAAKAVKVSLANKVSRVNPVLDLVKARDKDKVRLKVEVALVSSNTTTTKLDKIKAKVAAVKATSNSRAAKTVSSNKLEASKTKAAAKVKTRAKDNKITAMAVISHVLTAAARDTLTLTAKRHHTRLGTRRRKTWPKRLVAKWPQLTRQSKLLQMQFRTPLRCLASQSRASSRADS